MTSPWVVYVIRTSLYVAMTTLTAQAASSGYRGDHFLLMFPDLGWTLADRPNPVITVNSNQDNNDDSLVSIDAYNSRDELLQTNNCSAVSRQNLEFNSSYYLTAGLVESKAIRLTASRPVTCRTNSGTSQVFLIMPSKWLGTEYHISIPPATSSSQKIVSVLAFAALFADTNISLTLTGDTFNVTLPESAVKEGNTVNFTLGENETVQVNSEDEALSGAFINSTQLVGVISGAVLTSSVSGSGEGRMVAPLLPTSQWGRKVVVVLPPLQGAHVSVDVVGVANCLMTVSNGTHQQEIDLDVSGQARHDLLCDVTCPAVLVTCMAPVSMTSYIFPGNDITNATMIHVTPTERYNHIYKVRTQTTDPDGLQAVIVAPPGLDQNQLKIVVGAGTSNSLVGAGDGNRWKPLNADGTSEVSTIEWRRIGNTMFEFTCIQLKLANKVYRIEHNAEKAFGLFVYRFSDDAILDIPMVMRLVKLDGAYPQSTEVPGNGQVGGEPITNPPPGHVTQAGLTNGNPDTPTTQAMTNTMTSESEGNATNTTEPTKTLTTTVKPKLQTDLSKEIIICASVLLGVPLLIVLGVAVQACVTSDKASSGGWDRMTKPEVYPIETMTMEPGAEDCHDMEGETSC